MSGPTTIVTQTRLRPEEADGFVQWQAETSRIVAGFPGFLRQTVMPPSPPGQVDWVILQSFADREAAVAWLRSDERQQRLAVIQPWVMGHDDVHLVSDDSSSGVLPAPVSMVVSTRTKPGQEAAYRKWEQRIAAAQSRAPGFQGYRLEPPVPGVQEDWLAILRFDSEASLQGWLDSPARAALLREAAAFTETFNTRIARTGFDQWFKVATGGQASPPAWQQNMLVVLMLYPVVFLFGAYVQAPLLMQRAGLAFPVALFIGNVVSVLLLNYLVPWVSNRFAWWLQPTGSAVSRIKLGGFILLTALYTLMLFAFSWMS